MACLRGITSRTSALARYQSLTRGLDDCRHCCVRQLAQLKDVKDTPVKYTTSGAYKWKARYSFYGSNQDADISPSYQPIVVSISMAIFMLYFFVFREENDLDEFMDQSLYDKIPGLEKKQILLCIKVYEERGKDTAALRKRLREIIEEEMKKEGTIPAHDK